MNFIHNIYLISGSARPELHVIADLADPIDAVVAGPVDFENVEAVAGRDFLAAIAHAARRNRRPLHAVKCFREDSGGGCLARPARSHEEIGMRQPILFDGILECARDVSLADKIVERLRAVLSRENLITHRSNLIRFNRPRKQKRKIATGLTGFLQDYGRKQALHSALDVGR